MIGKWLDGLGDVERDRVIEAQGWTTGSLGGSDGPRCLLGHAFLVTSREYMGGNWPAVDASWGVTYRFDRLCHRYGVDNVVRWIKARAARGVTSRVVEIAPEAVAR